MEGYDVDTAETGMEAIEKSRTQLYNLALLDIKLPDIEGTQLLTKMNQDTPRMMKIMITGYPRLENAVDSLNLGADAYVVKPVNPEELLKIVKEKLEEQEKAEKTSEEKVKQWVESRLQERKERMRSLVAKLQEIYEEHQAAEKEPS